MKTLFKIGGYVIAAIFLIVVGAVAYVMTQFPKETEVTELKIVPTEEMVERGKYLANTTFGCIDCHSMRDPEKMNMPLVPGTEGMGGMDIGEGAGFIPAKNITPDIETGVGGWTDGELFRAITTGISKDGSHLAPNMPYMMFGKADSTDIIAIIAYLRTLQPIHNKIPERSVDFPLSLIFRVLPEDANMKPLDKNDPMAVGQYMSQACFACHTPRDGAEFNIEEMMAGGSEFPMPFGTVRSSNITPDNEMGIGLWTKEMFIKRFKDAADPKNHTPVKPGEFNSPMPWTFFGNLTEEDLGAIYDYLRSVPPNKKKVEKFTPGSMPPTTRK